MAVNGLVRALPNIAVWLLFVQVPGSWNQRDEMFTFMCNAVGARSRNPQRARHAERSSLKPGRDPGACFRPGITSCGRRAQAGDLPPNVTQCADDVRRKTVHVHMSITASHRRAECVNRRRLVSCDRAEPCRAPSFTIIDSLTQAPRRLSADTSSRAARLK
jgi:hypothetical protein